MEQASLSTRRHLLRGAGTAAAGLALATWGAAAPVRADSLASANAPSPTEALRILLEGNQRYVANYPVAPRRAADRRHETAKGQAPFAAILSCIDSRVPPEIVFDQGIGDLFVIRSAGHVLDNAIYGSIEFAAYKPAIPLVLVLGHSQCGAIKTTMRVLEERSTAPGHLDMLVKAIRPAVERAKLQSEDVLDGAIRANIALTVNILRSLPMLATNVSSGKTLIVGAKYNLETGAVDLAVA